MFPDDLDYFFLNHLQPINADNGTYYNHRFLGKGGNGTAFLVTASSGPYFGLQFVLKVFHRISRPERRQAFLDEIRLLRNLDHPAIIQVYDEGEFRTKQATYPFAVVEYVPRTARQLLGSQLDRLQAVRIAMNCLSALQAIHQLEPPLIHRDLKPENILISQVTAKLADFGLAKQLQESVQQDVIESNELDALNGTQWPGMPFRYRTPELVERARDRSRDVSAASDIYQFGTVLYELLTGYNPQKHPNDVRDPIKLDTRTIHGEQGKVLEDLTGQMLATDPAERPCAADCLQSLNRVHRELCGAYKHVQGYPA